MQVQIVLNKQIKMIYMTIMHDNEYTDINNRLQLFEWQVPGYVKGV